MRNFSIFSAVRSLLALFALAALVASSAGAAKRKEQSIEELTNFLLGPGYSQWLVGAVSKIATDDERERYLRLKTDDEAAAFIEEFWRHRDDPSRPWPQEQVQGIYERRAREADKLFTEATHRGRRTARGETHILYGPPERIEYFQEPRARRGGTVEVWIYRKDTEPGLDGDRPQARYFFVKKGNLTVRHHPGPGSQRLLRQGRR